MQNVGILCIDFYSSEAITRMPNRIYRAYGGDYQKLATSLLKQLSYSASNLTGRSQGMYYSVNCCDDKVTDRTGEEILKYAQNYPAMSSLPLTEFALGKHITDIAAKWGARSAGPAEHKAVISDIPTLILAGKFDQNTPSYWGKLAGETLTNSNSNDELCSLLQNSNFRTPNSKIRPLISVLCQLTSEI